MAAAPGIHRTSGLVRLGMFAIVSLLTFGNLVYAQSDHDFSQACRDEVSRRLNIDSRDVQTTIRGGSGMKSIDWNMRGGDQRRGSCQVNRNLRVVNFDQYVGGGYSGAGQYPGGQGNNDFERVCRDEVVRRLNVRNRDVQTRFEGGDRIKTIQWNVEEGDRRRGSCQVNRNFQVVNFDQNGGGGYYPGGGGYDGGRGGPGRMTWRGRVDNRVEITIRGNRCLTRTLDGNPTSGETCNFSNSLPRYDTRINVRKRDGRGKVRVIESPNNRNNYTARIEIEDDDGGSDNYEIEVEWN